MAVTAAGQPATRPQGPSRQAQLAKTYALPNPLKTFPLPVVVPHNPLSILHVAVTWVKQVVLPYASHPSPAYRGFFDRDSRSVHVLERRSIRGLWESGFFGKGSLSRSEPSWLDRERARRGAGRKVTSEDVTRQRRAQRQQSKWERARKEREAIDQRILEEAGIANGSHLKRPAAQSTSPDSELHTGGAEKSEHSIASLSIGISAEGASTAHPTTVAPQKVQGSLEIIPPIGPLELLALPNSSTDHASRAQSQNATTMGQSSGVAQLVRGNGRKHTDSREAGHALVNDGTGDGLGKSFHDHPTPDRASPSPQETQQRKENTRRVRLSSVFNGNGNVKSADDHEVPDIVNREHYQLSLEEALFLSFGLGCLDIMDSTTATTMSHATLMREFRLAHTSPPDRFDDPFLLQYIVYHHYRSLGWVVRSGIKFSVDFLLYARGPVFTHAQFAVVILPAFSHDFWSSSAEHRDFARSREARAWSWLHCVNRVITQVRKSLVLVYVDVPPPLPPAQESALGLAGVMARYRLREVSLKRWSANRSRD